ncbi:MAG: hypothetical protein SWY16_00780 [Cyanobacteriota bacterium]|nr:hypothetical protein [Cyanobacteriota bacterium]
MAILAKLFGGVATEQIETKQTRAFQLVLVLLLTSIVSSIWVASAQAIPKKPFIRSTQNPVSSITPSTARTSLPDGVYLQGESSEPQQIGRSYAIFEVRQERVIGAFYQPSSSFDCFYGSSQHDRLALNVINSYSQQAFPYTVAVENSTLVAGTESAATEPRLVGFHPIEEISQSDRDILATCQATLAR